MFKDLAIVKVLIDAGADVTTRNARGETALLIASRIGCDDIVRLLLAHKFNISDRDVLGTTAIISAACSCHLNAVKLLVERGADVNAQDIFGRTAIHEAAYYGWRKILAFLLTRVTSRLNLNAKAGPEATKVQFFVTDINVLNVKSGSYRASFRLDSSALRIRRLCMDGGIMYLEVCGDCSRICISELIVRGGFLSVAILGKNPEVCIRTLRSEGGYCCLQARGRNSYVQVQKLEIVGGNVGIRTKTTDSRVRICDFEISGGSLHAISTRGSEKWGMDFCAIGSRQGFPPEPQFTHNVDLQKEKRCSGGITDLVEVGIQIKCYGKPRG